MTKLLGASAFAILALMVVPQAYAAPVFCTGTVDTVSSGASVAGSFLLNSAGASSGNCVEAGDKVFGAFSVNGAITGAGSSNFTFEMTPGNVTLGFQGSVNVSSTGGVDYTVAVDPALSQGFLIDDLQKDLTLNAANVTGSASATLTGTETVDAFNFSCTRTVNPAGGTCPEDHVFATDVSQMSVTQTVTTNANAIVTGLTDTISQVGPTGVSEPGSLALLGSALLGLGMIARRRRNG